MSKLLVVLFFFASVISAAAEVVSVTLPSPTNGLVITNGCIPVYAEAKSDIGSQITGWRVYVDGVSKYVLSNTSRVHTLICVPTVTTGAHKVTVKAWSKTGVSGAAPSIGVTINNVFQIVATKAEPLSPAPGQSFTNGLIRVATAVESPYQISAWVVYIDGVKRFTSFQGAQQVKHYFDVPVGTHKVTVKVWDINNSVRSYSASNIFVVKDPMNTDAFVKPPSTATTFTNMDRQGALGWKTPKTGGAASCRGDDLLCIAQAPIAIAKSVQFLADPSPLSVTSDGTSAVLETLLGTEPYGNALYGVNNFENDSSHGHFVWDLWVMPTSANIQTFEIDLASTVGGLTYMMGTQCNVAAAYWDFWDDTAQSSTHPLPPHWQHATPKPENNDLVCNPQPNQWMHLRYHIVRGSGTYQFVSLEVDGVNHSLSELPVSSPRDRGWSDGTRIQLQLDSNASATPFRLYIDKMNLTKW
jgi:hypothetical protein